MHVGAYGTGTWGVEGMGFGSRLGLSLPVGIESIQHNPRKPPQAANGRDGLVIVMEQEEQEQEKSPDMDSDQNTQRPHENPYNPTHPMELSLINQSYQITALRDLLPIPLNVTYSMVCGDALHRDLRDDTGSPVVVVALGTVRVAVFACGPWLMGLKAKIVAVDVDIESHVDGHVDRAMAMDRHVDRDMESQSKEAFVIAKHEQAFLDLGRRILRIQSTAIPSNPYDSKALLTVLVTAGLVVVCEVWVSRPSDRVKCVNTEASLEGLSESSESASDSIAESITASTTNKYRVHLTQIDSFRCPGGALDVKCNPIIENQVAVLGNRRDILIWDVQSTTKSNTKTDTKSAARRQVRTIPGSLWYSENLSDDLPPLMSSPVEPSPLSNCSTGHARTHARAATRAGVEGRGRGRRGGRVGGNGSGSCRVRGNGIRSGRVGENDAATRARHGAGAWGGLLDLPFPKRPLILKKDLLWGKKEPYETFFSSENDPVPEFEPKPGRGYGPQARPQAGSDQHKHPKPQTLPNPARDTDPYDADQDLNTGIHSTQGGGTRRRKRLRRRKAYSKTNTPLDPTFDPRMAMNLTNAQKTVEAFGVSFGLVPLHELKCASGVVDSEHLTIAQETASKHSQYRKRKQTYLMTCGYCNKGFKSKIDYRRHMQWERSTRVGGMQNPFSHGSTQNRETSQVPGLMSRLRRQTSNDLYPGLGLGALAPRLWFGNAERLMWGSVEFGPHPQTMFVMSPSALHMIDQRDPKPNRISLDYLTTKTSQGFALFAMGVHPASYGARRFELALLNTHHLSLYDHRMMGRPLIRWKHLCESRPSTVIQFQPQLRPQSHSSRMIAIRCEDKNALVTFRYTNAQTKIQTDQKLRGFAPRSDDAPQMHYLNCCSKSNLGEPHGFAFVPYLDRSTSQSRSHDQTSSRTCGRLLVNCGGRLSTKKLSLVKESRRQKRQRDPLTSTSLSAPAFHPVETPQGSSDPVRRACGSLIIDPETLTSNAKTLREKVQHGERWERKLDTEHKEHGESGEVEESEEHGEFYKRIVDLYLENPDLRSEAFRHPISPNECAYLIAQRYQQRGKYAENKAREDNGKDSESKTGDAKRVETRKGNANNKKCDDNPINALMLLPYIKKRLAKMSTPSGPLRELPSSTVGDDMYVVADILEQLQGQENDAAREETETEEQIYKYQDEMTPSVRNHQKHTEEKEVEISDAQLLAMI